MSHRMSRHRFRRLMLRRLFILLLLLLQMALIVLSIAYYSHLRFVNVALTLLATLTALHLLMHDQPVGFKLSLVFLILLFPVFGGVLYWIFHYQTATVGFRKRLHRVEDAASPALRAEGRIGMPKEEAGARIPESARLIHYLDGVVGFPVYANTACTYYPDGLSLQAALLDELRQAKRYIFLEYFIIGEGAFWDSILEVLRERAAAGVDVRVIYDDLGCFLTLPPKYAELLNSYGIQCRVFNPFRPFLTSIQNNRDHRKIAVIDGATAFTGGINLADEYINRRVRFGHWKDSAVRLHGDAAWSFAVMFLQMWSFLSSSAEDYLSFFPSAPSSPLAPSGLIQPYTDSPMDRENVGEHVYLQIIGNARRYLYITTPYLAVDDTLISALKVASKSGVDVRILTPRRPDKRLVHFTTRSYYRELLDAGVEIYEYTDGFVHAKSMVSDDLVASVGTVNLDYRSLYLHFECGVCLYRADAIHAIKEDFLSTLPSCHRITASDCKTSPVGRLLQEICRLLAPLM